MTLFADGSTGASRPNICYRCTYVLKQRKKSIANPNSNPNPNRGHSRPRVSRFCGPTFYFANILANHPFLQDGPTSLRAQDRSTRLLTPPGAATVIGRIVPSEQQRQTVIGHPLQACRMHIHSSSSLRSSRGPNNSSLPHPPSTSNLGSSSSRTW